MKKMQIISVLVIMVLLLSLFAGCNKTDEPNQPSPTPSVSATDSGQQQGSTDDDLTGYPIKGDRTSFSIWAGGFSSANKYGYTTWEEYPVYLEIEKRTNVHIDWILPSSADEDTNFSLIMASQELPDSFQTGMTKYLGGLDSYIDDGIIIDVKDLASKYAPNYMDYFQSEEEFRKGFITDSGYMPGFYAIMKQAEGSWIGPVIRADLYDHYGRPDPETIDDLHDYLAFMKDEYKLDGPMLFNQQGLTQFILAAWNIETKFYVDGNTVMYGAVQPEFKDYVQTMRDWYTEGLIDRDFASKSDTSTDVLTDKYVYYEAFYGSFDQNAMSAENPNYRIRAVGVPTLEAGQKRYVRDIAWHDVFRIRNSVGTITVSCAEPEILARWYNYFYTEEGYILANYGTEDIHYIDEAGKPQFKKELFENIPEGFTPSDVVSEYNMPVGVVHIYDWTKQYLPTLAQDSIEANSIWDKNFEQRRTMPNMISLTSDESTAYTSIATDINTYIEENVVKFITGQTKTDDFDAFVDQIYAMGLEKMISYQQAALDRYNER